MAQSEYYGAMTDDFADTPLVVTLASRRRDQRAAEYKKLSVWNSIIVEAAARADATHRLEVRLAR